jgi:hypothetical protein
MFKDYNIEHLCDEVFVVKNFLSEKECKEIVAATQRVNFLEHDNTFWGFEPLKKYNDRVLDLISGENLVFDNLESITVREVGAGMRLHQDITNRLNKYYELEVDIMSEVSKTMCQLGKYGFTIYFNSDYTGGEISYPEYDINYKPEVGDMIIHNAAIIHGVKVVKSGKRFTHSGTLDSKFLVDRKKLIDLERLGDYDDPEKGNFAIHQGRIDNLRFKKFIETYVDKQEYHTP